MKKLILFLLAVAASLILSQAQSGELKGVVTDNHNEPVPFANVAIYRGNQLVTGGVANIDGEYSVKPITQGIYQVVISSVGYTKERITDVQIDSGQVFLLNGTLAYETITVCNFYRTTLIIPVINKDQTEQGSSWNRRDVSGSPAHDVVDLTHPSWNIHVYRQRSSHRNARVIVGIRKNAMKTMAKK